MRTAIWRILGNDLPGRHASDQTENNLRFMLEREPNFSGSEKFFLLNRIIDRQKVERLKECIERAGYSYDEIPFKLSEFSCLPMSDQQGYVTNVNAARNYCIRKSRDFDYVLPLDGASFFRQDGWDEFAKSLPLAPPYVALKQSRATSYDKVFGEQAFEEDYRLGNNIVRTLRELTLAFSRYSDCYFDESRNYGDLDKIELLWRLGFNSPVWDQWGAREKKEAVARKSRYYGKVPTSGYVIRLPSGNVLADTDNKQRGRDRFVGLQRLLENVRRTTKT